jgi:transcriptional antiterminator NusG
VSNDIDNTTDPLPPDADAPLHVSAPGPQAENFVRDDATEMESVHTENEVGPVDLTGETDQPAGESSPRAADDRETPRDIVYEPAATAKAVTAEPEEDVPVNRQWYILKVQTNREDSIRDALQRRVAMAGLDKYFGEIIVPTEMVSEFKGGKKRVSKRKLYPGYIVVNMEINDDTWYLVRETSGIGDFTGAMGRPTPMAPQDVAKIIQKTEEKTDEAPRVDIRFKPADRVRIKDGTFENFEGNVETIDQANGRVTVMINIFGRSTPVELEYWQIEAV